MTDRIKVGLTIAPSYGVQQGANVDGKDNAVARSLSFPGWVLAGSGRNAGADPYKYYDTWGPGPNNVSPYVQATATERENADTRINTSLNATINIIKGLNVIGMVAWNFRNNNERIYTPTWCNGNGMWLLIPVNIPAQAMRLFLLIHYCFRDLLHIIRNGEFIVLMQ